MLRFHYLVPEKVPAGVPEMARLELEREPDLGRWKERERWMERWMGRYLVRRWEQ